MNAMNLDTGSWFLAQLRPNQLKRAKANLQRQGYPCFAPWRPLTKRKGSRLVESKEMLFPGYVFLTILPTQAWRPINSTYGITGLVMRSSNTPQPVPSSVMIELFDRTDADGTLIPTKSLKLGQSVRITVGPLVNFVARVERLEQSDRVGVLMEMMGQAVRIAVPRTNLESTTP